MIILVVTKNQKIIDNLLYHRDFYSYHRGNIRYKKGATYETYQPACRTGYEDRTRYTGRSFEEAETDLRSDYERNRGASSLTWEHAKDATRDAWHRVERAIPGDFDKDGR